LCAVPFLLRLDLSTLCASTDAMCYVRHTLLCRVAYADLQSSMQICRCAFCGKHCRVVTLFRVITAQAVLRNCEIGSYSVTSLEYFLRAL
jgi:hypothetical protein